MDLKDAPEFQLFANVTPGVTLDDDQVVPSLQEFATVGHLYRGIEQGFRLLVDKYGEQRVFIGPSRAQATQQYFGWPELVAVTDLASAVQAIETIVEQGEGARGDWQVSHYGQFFSIAQEYRTLKQQDPGFEPARSAVPAYVKPPSDTSEAVLIADPLTANVSELFNACYEVMLQMLTRYFIHGSDSEEELRILSGTAVDMMFVAIKPLGELLTRLPVGPGLPGKMAGPNFEIFHTGYILPHHYAAWAILHERLLAIADFCARLGMDHSAPGVLTAIGADVRKLATRMEPYLTQ